MSTFVFFHIGSDLTQPNRLVQSIKKTNPGAEIVMASDPDTPDVVGVTQRVNIKGDRKNIMLLRLAGFVAVQATKPAIYLDTDMVVKTEINPEKILGDKTAMLCRRTFHREAIFNHNLRGMDFSEYEGKTLYEVYPILACATVTQNWRPWAEMVAMMDFIHPKYKLWYGDQEALKLYARVEDEARIGYINEGEYACLPEMEGQLKPAPKIIHYKGGRK